MACSTGSGMSACAIRAIRARYLMSRSLAPALVAEGDIVLHDQENEPVFASDRGTKLYYKRWIHGEVYKARADVGAIVHSHSPTVVFRAYYTEINARQQFHA
jgi:ribulose-5-phosphate 4-epimerase/fuculose-1-phosphate aldolase